MRQELKMPTIRVARGQGLSNPHCNYMDLRVLDMAEKLSTKCALPHKSARLRAASMQVFSLNYSLTECPAGHYHR